MNNKKLRVWWIPQLGMKGQFTVDVSSVREGAKIMKVLAEYDLFQYRNKIKPDYANTGGLIMWEEDSDGEGNPDWIDWCDEETGIYDPEEWVLYAETVPNPQKRDKINK